MPDNLEADFTVQSNNLNANFDVVSNNLVAELVVQYTPNKTSQLINDSGFVTQENIDTAITTEANARIATDERLQEQIDQWNDAFDGYRTAAAQDVIDSAIREEISNEANVRLANDQVLQRNINTKQDIITDLNTIRAGASAGATAVQPAELNNYVPTTRKVNGKALTADITLTATDVGALSTDTLHNSLSGRASSGAHPISAITDLQNTLNGKQATLTTAQLAAVNSGVTAVDVETISTNTSNITTISSKIPSAATSSNQLADKAFVNSSINAVAAYYITSDAQGDAFATKANLDTGPWYFNGASRTPTTNDYAVVEEDETHDGKTTRYTYTGSQWAYQYTFNTTPFTQAWLDALNSGIDSNLVSEYSTHVADTDIHVTTAEKTTWNGKQDAISDLSTIRAGATAGATAVQPGDLATVATTGAYSDLSGKPTIPTDTNQLTNGAGYITSAALTGYATETWVEGKGYIDNTSEKITWYGTCSTGGSTQEKVVTCSGFALVTGVSIRVKFDNNQIYNGVPKLNVNSTGAVEVKLRGTTNGLRYMWQAGDIVDFTYDGTYWIWDRGGIATVSYYGITRLVNSATSTSTSGALTPSSLNEFAGTLVTDYPSYSASSTYSVGDKVRYSYGCYECNTAISVAEAWDPTHWTLLAPLTTQIDTLSSSIPTVNNSTIVFTQGGVSKGSFTLNQANGATIELDAGGSGSGNYLFEFIPSDHLLNNQNWLRADTFSWHNGVTYQEAYDHLVDDFSNLVGTTYYAWNDGDTGDSDANPVYTLSATPSVGDDVYGSVGGGPIEVVGTVGTYVSDAITVSSGNYNFPYSMNRDSSSDFTEPNTETIGSYTITYYLAQDGHKIILPDQETTATNIYNESGIAWYYVLDTANTRFKLPRTKYGFVGLRDTVGKYVPESLPNLTSGNQTISIISNPTNDSLTSGPFVETNRDGYGGLSSYNYRHYFKFDASNASSTYQDNAPVQQRATQMYLYFYVGEYSQSATEQTAGLNAELFNGKADTDLGNISASGESVVKGIFDTKIVLVNSLPATPDNDVWYAIPE